MEEYTYYKNSHTGGYHVIQHLGRLPGSKAYHCRRLAITENIETAKAVIAMAKENSNGRKKR